MWVLKFDEVGTLANKNQNHNIQGNFRFLCINLSPEYVVFVTKKRQHKNKDKLENKNKKHKKRKPFRE